MAFDINSDNVRSVTFYGNGEELITGAASVDLGGSDPASTATGSSYVSVSPESGTFSPGRYYAVVIPAELNSGVTFAISTDSGKFTRTSSKKAILPIN